jgi:sugar phosphate isomerase/epimerase
VPHKASLNLATLGPADLADKLHAAAVAGFRAVGLIRADLEEKGEEAVEELRLSELAMSELGNLSGWMDEDRTSRLVALAQAEQAFELAASLGCEVLIARPSIGGPDTFAAARAFCELCRLAEPFGRRVALEFLGLPDQGRDVSEAWEIVEAAEAENGGLLIDTFYFYRGGSTLEMLAAVPGEKIFLVQLSDCPEMPLRQMEDRHRLYPGGGALPLEPVLAAVQDKGYQGYYSLELHNEDYWQEDPVLVATEGWRALRRLEIT